MSETRTDISELGEFGIIDQLTKGVELKNESSITGVGDDAAVIDAGNGEYLLVSTDALIEGIHFNLMYMPLKHLGYKAVAVNVSDICAMNGKAEQITVALAVSNRFSLEALEELYAGIKLACTEFNVDLVGGDDALAKDIAMHIAAAKPKSLDASGVDAALIEAERRVAIEKAKEINKASFLPLYANSV